MSFTICDILGVPINNVNLIEATAVAMLGFEKDEKSLIFTPNPEFVINALEDKEFMEILNSSSLNVADGIGIVIASKILGFPLRERVAGYDLVQSIFSKMKYSENTVYFLGSDKDTVFKAKDMMEKKYQGLKILGAHDGYFDEKNENIIIDEINSLKPDLLLVGLGSPKQEKWIYKNKDKIDAKVFIGVGGSFDVMSGNVKRAPKLFIKLHLEWFYRLITQPTRIKRMLKLPLFLLKVVSYKMKGAKNGKFIKK